MHVSSEPGKLKLKRGNDSCVIYPMRYTFYFFIIYLLFMVKEKTHLKGLKAAKNIRLAIKN